MLFLSIFLAGYTLGVFVTLRIFSPEKQEEAWDPQNFPATSNSINIKLSPQGFTKPKISLVKKKLDIKQSRFTSIHLNSADLSG